MIMLCSKYKECDIKECSHKKPHKIQDLDSCLKTCYHLSCNCKTEINIRRKEKLKNINLIKDKI